jgi:peptidoglycan/xylan/chitin deacetylase (PgdA/CDA1 family)
MLDVYEPGGAKVENTWTDSLDPDTLELGHLFWREQGGYLPPGGQIEFSAGYSLWKSVVDHDYQAGDYTLRYRAWKGRPGAVGSEPIGEVQEKTLTISPAPAAPNVSAPILMYHRVDDIATGEYWISTEEFEAQMKALVAYGYETVSTLDIYDYNYHGSALPPKPVVITFDDGYENVYRRAYPILLDQGLFGEFYIVTNETAFASYARKYSYRHGSGVLGNPQLIWPEIIEMAAGGMVFGSHTKSHRDLTTLTRAEQEDEIFESRRELFLQAGIDTVSFAYPYGAGNGDAGIHQLLASHGYSTAVSAWQGICQTQTADPLGYKRVYVHGPNPASNPSSDGVSVNYDPSNPDDFFMSKIDPGFPVPIITIESVEFLDEFGNPRPCDPFFVGERILVRVTARNDGDGADVAVSLKLDDDGIEPFVYDSHQALPSENIVGFFATTTGSAETFEFPWEIPDVASTNLFDYSIEFHDQTNTLGFSLDGWAPICLP